MKAHVIMCNDAVKFVVVGPETAAIVRKNLMKDEHFNEIRFKQMLCRYDYGERYNWHIETVDSMVYREAQV